MKNNVVMRVSRAPRVLCTLALLLLPLFAHAQWSEQDLVDQVLVANPGVEALVYAQQAALAHARQAGDLDDPMLSYALAPNSLGVTDLESGHIVGLSQQLPWPGKRKAQRAEANAQARVAAAELSNLQRAAMRQARQLYAQWYLVNESLSIQQQQLSLLSTLRDISAAQSRSGRGQQRAVVLAVLRQTQAEQELIRLQARVQQIKAQINALRNVAMDTPVPLATLQLEDQHAVSGDLQQHPELSVLQAALDAADQRRALASLASRPDIQLNAKYVGTMGREENRTQLGVSFKLPFGQSKYRQREQRAAAQSAQLQQSYQQRRNALNADFERARAAWRAAQDIRVLYRDSLLPLAEQNLQLAQAEYASGRGSASALVEAQDEWLDMQLGLARSASQQLNEYANLLWLTGTEL
ncbi:MAG: TolC family protein [Oceanococcus sp.]